MSVRIHSSSLRLGMRQLFETLAKPLGARSTQPGRLVARLARKAFEDFAA